MEESVGKAIRIIFTDGEIIEKYCEEYVRKETNMKKVIFYAPDDRYIADDRNNTEDHHRAIREMNDKEFNEFCKLRESGRDIEVYIND